MKPKSLSTKPAGPYDYYRQHLLSPERVRELSQLRPARVVQDTLACWAVIVLCWVAVALCPKWWTILPALFLIGARYYALLVIGHDGFHRRALPSKAINDLFCDVLIFAPIGVITRRNGKNHLAHHHYLATAEDPDRHKHSCADKIRVTQVLAYLTGFASLTISVHNVFLGRAVQRSPNDETRYRARDVVLILGWQTILFGGLFLAIGWWAYFVLWVLPFYLGGFLTDNLRSFAEHSHPANDEWADGNRLITFVSNPVERFFLAPMNMNYHAAHHIWPSIPYYNLPIADREMQASPFADGLIWRKSYVGYIRSYLSRCPLPSGSIPPRESI